MSEKQPTKLKDNERYCWYKQNNKWIEGIFHGWGSNASISSDSIQRTINSIYTIAIIEDMKEGKFKSIRIENISFAAIPGKSRFYD